MCQKLFAYSTPQTPYWTKGKGSGTEERRGRKEDEEVKDGNKVREWEKEE